MTKCAKCGESVSLPYLCRRCNGYYCAKHRLPESHDCRGLHEGKDEFARKEDKVKQISESKLEHSTEDVTMKEDRAAWISTRPYRLQSSYYPQYEARRGKAYFSRTEIQHLLFASILLILFSLSLVYPDFLIVFPSAFDLTSFLFVTAVLFLSFLPHELMHKAVAQRYGLFAEFRIILSYAMLTLLTIFLPFFPFRIFAPGAVMIGGAERPGDYGKTAAAGPATNVVVGVVMLGLSFVFPSYGAFFLLGVYLSGWLAFFNLIPFAPLDGEKILHWNKAVFSILLVASLTLFVYAFLI